MDATTHVRVGPDTAVSAVVTGDRAHPRGLVDAIRISDPEATGSYLDGHAVIPAQQLDAILSDLAYTPGSAYAVEVSTDNDHPGRVLVYTGCPRCGILQPVTAMVRARLTEDPEAAYIKRWCRPHHPPSAMALPGHKERQGAT